MKYRITYFVHDYSNEKQEMRGFLGGKTLHDLNVWQEMSKIPQTVSIFLAEYNLK